MNSVKIISKVLFYFTRFLAILYFAMPAYSLFTFLTKWGLNIVREGKYFEVLFPFTQKPILLGDYNWAYMVFDFLAPLSLYGLFFLLASNVFKVFFQPKLFTEFGIKHLKRFYIANLTLPALMILTASVFTEIESEICSILFVLHTILGVFAYFLAAIFKQGVNLQKEQDLII